ncbi:MAG: TolC family protein [Candidatus Riflebacteria bacterium]|nr:TolC family protein [Candidatus Riflebacteria bacterium]
MRSVKCKFLSVFLFLLVARSVWSVEPLPISKAVNKALAYSPYIKAMKDGELAAAEKVGEARAMKGVKVSLGVSDSRLNSPMMAFGARLNQGRIDMSDFSPSRLNDPEYINNLQVGAQVALPLYLGGMDKHAVAAACQGVKISEQDSVKASEDIIFKTIEIYLGVVLARESVAVAEKACQTSQESLRNAQAAVEAERSVESDLLQAGVHHSQNEETLLRMKNQFALALESLATIMGEPSVQEYDLNMPFLQQECTTCQDLPANLLARALAQRPDYLKVARQSQALDHQEKLARGITRPRVIVGAVAENNRDGLNSSNQSNTMLFARMDWNIADGGEALHKARGARFQKGQMQNMEKALADQIHLEIRDAITNINNALERIRVSKLASEQSTESLRILRDRYSAGLAIVSDVLGAETSLFSHRMNHLKALYDYSISRARLKMALGELNLEHCDILKNPENQ